MKHTKQLLGTLFKALGSWLICVCDWSSSSSFSLSLVHYWASCNNRKLINFHMKYSAHTKIGDYKGPTNNSTHDISELVIWWQSSSYKNLSSSRNCQLHLHQLHNCVISSLYALPLCKPVTDLTELQLFQLITLTITQRSTRIYKEITKPSQPIHGNFWELVIHHLPSSHIHLI